MDRYFEDNVYPVLTPMAMDSSRPFPLIRNKTLNIGALISKKDEKGQRRADVCHCTGSVCSSEGSADPFEKSRKTPR